MIMNSKQVVVITGSSTGFGRLFADTLARKGHTVFATMRDPGGRNAKSASEIRALAEKDSLPIYVLELDVTDDASAAPRIPPDCEIHGMHAGVLMRVASCEQEALR
jgi:NAD(P)-dependent dehydrogenase (short-subunit alcohol dehydrogenase family)